jgi:hypothetical protein
MRSRRSTRLCAALLACACGPGTASSTEGTGDTGSGSGSADTGSDGSGDASATGDDTTDAGEPVCEPRTNATLDWQKGGSDDALPSAGRDIAVAIDGAGRVVVAATDETETDADILVSQLDPSGTLQWSLRYEGPAGLRDEVLGLAVDPEGFAYVAVREQTRELISEGFGNVAERTVVILAIDPEGGKRWRFDREIAPPEYNDNARAGDIALTPSGDVIVVDADADLASAQTPPSLLRLDRWGNELLRTDLATDMSDITSLRIATTPDGAIWITAAIYSEIRVLRTDAFGAIAWDERQTSGDYVTAITAGLNNEAYVLRTTGDPEAGDAGFQLSRYEPDGAVAWTQTLGFSTGSGYPAGIAIDCDGSPIVAAELEDYPMRTAWLTAFTAAGEPSWSAELPDAGNAGPRSIARGQDGTLALGGIEGSNDSFEPWLAHVR